jgi:shikimate dehydrogenase
MDAHTQLVAVIGHPVRHSLSPAIHNAAFQATGLNYAYVAFEVEDVASALAGVRGLGIRGLSVTIPHKVTVMEYLDEIDPVAREIGSVNTVVNRDGSLYGCSTDGPGALESLREEGAETEGKRVTILGAGGAARAVAFALAGDGEAASMRIVALREEWERTEALAEAVARFADIAVQAAELEDEKAFQGAVEDADLLVHATPVGMHPDVDESLVPTGWLCRLLQDAEKAGCRAVEGLGMFVHQAAIQFRLWTGEEPPVELMRSVVLRSLGEVGR